MNQSPKTPSSPGTVRLSKGRIEAFSDGVFAIVITLLIFNIKVPELPRGAPAAELGHALFELWPKFLSYGISVVVEGVYWVAHHLAFHWVKHSDRIFLWINILFLALVAVIPFSAALLGQYHGYQTAIVFYGANLIAVGLTLYFLWGYATSRHRLVDGDTDPRLIRNVKVRILTGFVVYSLSIALSFFNAKLSLVIYILLPVLFILPGRIDRFWRLTTIP